MKFSVEEKIVMTRLEWCRTNAPKAYAGYSDDELLQEMASIQELSKPIEKVYCISDIDQFLNPIDEMIRIFAGVFCNNCSFNTGYIDNKVRGNPSMVFKYVSDLGLYDQLLAALDAACSGFVEYGLASNYVLRKAVFPDFTCGATLFRDDDDILLTVSCSWDNICYGAVSLSFDAVNGEHTEVERLIAHKILNLFKSEENSTAIDMYDLYCLTNCFDFSPVKIRNYISMLTHGETLNYTELTPHSEADIQRYEKDYAGLHIVSSCIHGDVPKPEFYNVINRYYAVCENLNCDSDAIWNHEEGCVNLAKK